jgi:hypothetical protein
MQANNTEDRWIIKDYEYAYVYTDVMWTVMSCVSVLECLCVGQSRNP